MLTQQNSSTWSVNYDTLYDFLPFNWSTAGGLIPSAGYDWHTLKVYVRARELRADVMHVVVHAPQNDIRHRVGRIPARALVTVNLLNPFQVHHGHYANQQVGVTRYVHGRRRHTAVQPFVK